MRGNALKLSVLKRVRACADKQGVRWECSKPQALLRELGRSLSFTKGSHRPISPESKGPSLGEGESRR